jgi:hypothetical protein
MSDHPQHAGNGGYEREDLGAKTIYAFLIGLAVLGLIVYFVVVATFRGLDAYDRRHQPPQNPMKAAAEVDTRDLQTPKVSRQIEATFPEPRLETDERDEINDFRMHEDEQLNSYGWIDQSAGVVHIPIDRAMELVTQRGLPVRNQPSNPIQNQKPRKSESTKGPKK